MKFTTKVMTLALGIAASVSIISCNEAEEKPDEPIAEAEEQAEAATNLAIPKDPKGVIEMFENMNAELENVTGIETAKKALPALEKTGSLFKKGMVAVGEDEMEATLMANPELMAKFEAAFGKMKGHMDRINAESPEAYEFLDKKMDAVLE